jgi:integrase/recombinase XerC
MTELPAIVGQESRVSELVDHVFAVTDLRPSTRRTYSLAARAFTEWAIGRPLHVRVLVEYKAFLDRRTDLAAKTKNLYLSAARTVFRELFALGVLPYDASKPVRAFETSRLHRRPPITDEQVARAFRFAARRKDTRLRLILNLLYRQGLRQKEAVDIRVEDFNEHAATLAILGKGRDEREAINLHPETVKALRAYVSAMKIRGGYLFENPKGRSGHLGTSGLYKLLRKVHLACGIANTPHGWRKVFTSKLIDSGLNLIDVQAWTRHRSLDMLRVYYDRLTITKTLPAYYRAFEVATLPGAKKAAEFEQQRPA